MRTSDQFTSIFADVVKKLPDPVQAALAKFWAKKPAVDPFDKKQHKAPYVILAKDWTKTAAELGTNTLANAGDGRFVLFDADFVLEAPTEVVETLVAHELAHAYQTATGSTLKSQQESEDQVEQFLTEWGFCESCIELWMAAREFNPINPHKAFYDHLPTLIAKHVAGELHLSDEPDFKVRPPWAAGSNSSCTQPMRRAAKIGRNAPCPCGSGKKFKKCCSLRRQHIHE